MSTASGKTFADRLKERAQKIAYSLRIFHPAKTVFEVRGLEVGEYGQTYAGFFDDPDKAAEAIARLDMQDSPKGVYHTLNPVMEEMLCRINNRVKKVKNGELAADKHVKRRLWLIIDVDPERAGGVAGIPASEDEKEIARLRAEQVLEWLMKEFGWHEPIQMDSGNGCYLIFPIDLPNDAESTQLLRRILNAINAKWGDSQAKIDISMFNAARIARVFLTLNRKGD